MSRLAAAVTAAFTNGFAAQAEQYGAELHRKAVEARANCPATIFWLATFDRQARDRGQRAMLAEQRGDHDAARRLAESAMMAVENKRRVQAAVDG